MQELIDELKKLSTAVSKENNLDMVAAFSYAIDVARLSIEKEKEQIIDTFNYGYYCASSGTDTEFELKGSSYYNKTYNQKT